LKRMTLSLDQDIEERLRLFERAVGGVSSGRAGKKGEIIRWLLDKHLPSQEDLEAVAQWSRYNGWQREKRQEPQIPNLVTEFKNDA
jgi:hypothetical protein